MTPREHDTLETILRSVESDNGREVGTAEPRMGCLKIGHVHHNVCMIFYEGDTVIDGVTFRSTKARCA